MRLGKEHQCVERPHKRYGRPRRRPARQLGNDRAAQLRELAQRSVAPRGVALAERLPSSSASVLQLTPSPSAHESLVRAESTATVAAAPVPVGGLSALYRASLLCASQPGSTAAANVSASGPGTPGTACVRDQSGQSVSSAPAALEQGDELPFPACCFDCLCLSRFRGGLCPLDAPFCFLLFSSLVVAMIR